MQQFNIIPDTSWRHIIYWQSYTLIAIWLCYSTNENLKSNIYEIYAIYLKYLFLYFSFKFKI